jgi:hypothetical protein
MDPYKIDTLKVMQFWEWFSANCQNFGVDFDNIELLESLENWVTQLGDFSWEVGPGKVKDNMLVMSPNGDEGLIEAAKQIVSSATPCERWEYYYAKPSKENGWDLTFRFEADGEEVVDVDASSWEYTLLEYEDGMFEIIVKAPDLEELGESDKETSVEILLDGLLGEETRMQTICGIEVVVEFEEQYREKAGTIKNLPGHLRTLTRG